MSINVRQEHHYSYWKMESGCPVRVVEKIQLRSRLTERILLIDWTVDEVMECLIVFAQQQSGNGRLTMPGLSVRSPVFGSSRDGGRHKWQLTLNLNSVCSSSLSLKLAAGSETVNARYIIGIADNEGRLEYERHGRMLFNAEDAEVPYEEQHPTVLFNWAQLIEKKAKLLNDDRLHIHCEITTVGQEDDPVS